jgi:hypothetical protein
MEGAAQEGFKLRSIHPLDILGAEVSDTGSVISEPSGRKQVLLS